MVKRGLLVVVGSFALCFSVAAQQASSPELKPLVPLRGANVLALDQQRVFRTLDSSALIRGLPMLALLNGNALPVSSELGRMGMEQIDLFPSLLLSDFETQTVSISARNRTDGKDFSTDGKDYGSMSVSRSNPLHYSGEIGFLYGHSTGKFGGDVKQTYFIGEVGDDNVQITVGGSYEDSSFNFPRRGR